MILNELIEQDELFYKYQQDYFENQIEQFEIAIKFILQYSNILSDFSKKLNKLNNDYNNYMKKFQFNLLIDYIRVLFETKSINTINLVKSIQDFTKEDLLKILENQKNKLIQGFRVLKNIHMTTKEFKKEFQSKDYYFSKFQNQKTQRDSSSSLMDSLNNIYFSKMPQQKDYKVQKQELIQQTEQFKESKSKFEMKINKTEYILKAQNQRMFAHLQDLLRKLFVFEFSSMKNQEYDTNNLIKDFEQNSSFSTKMTQKIKLPHQNFYNTIITRNFQLKNYDIFQSEYKFFDILNKIICNEQIQQQEIYELEMLSENFIDWLKLLEYFEELQINDFIKLSVENFSLLKKITYDKLIKKLDLKNESICFRFIFQFQYFFCRENLTTINFKDDIEKLNLLNNQYLWREVVQQIYGLLLKRNFNKKYIQYVLNLNYLISMKYLDKTQSQDIFKTFEEEDLDFAEILKLQEIKLDEKTIFFA